MLYIDYELYKSKYYDAQTNFNEILDEKENLFASTQPKATNPDKEIVKGGSRENTFDAYLIKIEEKQIEARLQEARTILEDRGKLLRLKEEELRNSNNPYDKIYTYRYLDNLKIFKICRLVGYSEAQIYRVLRIIRKNVKMIENDSFCIVK